jgi:hypothetical protein
MSSSAATHIVRLAFELDRRGLAATALRYDTNRDKLRHALLLDRVRVVFVVDGGGWHVASGDR